MKKIISTLIAAVCVIACAFSFTACGDDNKGDNNGNQHASHNWSATYTEDGDRHYQTCDGCTEKSYSSHDYGTSGVCVCGKQKPEAPHTSHNWSTTYTQDGDRHYQTCDGCTEKNYNNHDYGTSGTCVCGKEKPVITVEVTGVTLNKTELTLEVDGTETLTATVAPEDATNKSVTYSVEPAGVVTVDNNGNVTAVAAGTATITATAANNKTVTCTVTVNAPLTNAEVLAYLNTNVKMKAIEKWDFEANEEKYKDVTWYITKDGENITSVNLFFVYHISAKYDIIELCKIDFAVPLTPQNIKAGKVENLTSTEIYQNMFDITIQTEHTALINAICNKLFGENTAATRYIIDNGNNSLDDLGNVSRFTVLEVTDTAIKEKNIKIVYASTDDGLIANLNDTTKNATYGEEKTSAITGTKLENNDQKF